MQDELNLVFLVISVYFLPMPKVKITHMSEHSAEDCFKKIQDLFENDKDLKKLNGEFECEFDEDNLCGNASGKQFKADMQISDHADGSQVDLTINLPMHLALAKGVVKTMLTKKLSKYVG